MSAVRSVVVLTGGGGIVGRAMTKKLTAGGHAAAVVDRDLDAATSVCDEIEDAGATAPHECDITDRDQLESLRIRDASDLGSVTATNLTGSMPCSQVFGAPMADAGFGAIVNVLSIYGITAPDQRIYEASEYEGRSITTPAIRSASKAGLWAPCSFTRATAGKSGVRMNAILPGGVFSGQNDTFVDACSRRAVPG